MSFTIRSFGTTSVFLTCLIIGALLFDPSRVEAVDQNKTEAIQNEIRRKEPISPQLAALLKERYKAAKTECDARMKEFEAGRGTLDFLYGSCERLLKAERALSDDKGDEKAALQANLDRMVAIEGIMKERYDAGRIAIQDYAVSTYHRADAAILLEQVSKKK